MGSLIAIALVVLGGSGATYWLLKRRASGLANATASTPTSTPALVNHPASVAPPALAVPPELPKPESPTPVAESSAPVADAAVPVESPGTTEPSATTEIPALDSVPDPVPVVDVPATIVASPESSPAAAIAPSASPETALVAMIATLGRSGQLAQVAHLKQYLTHRDSAIRVEAVAALGAIARRNPGAKSAAIVPLLGKLSQDGHPSVRLAAVEALGSIRSVAALPWLQQALNSSNPALVKTAARSLQRLKLDYGLKDGLKKDGLKSAPPLAKPPQRRATK